MSGCHITPNLGLSHGSHRPFTSETRTESVLQSTGGLASTRKGARIRYQGGKRTVIDGPFTESKGLIAGYAILDLPSRAAAVDWAMCFGDVVKVNEIRRPADAGVVIRERMTERRRLGDEGGRGIRPITAAEHSRPHSTRPLPRGARPLHSCRSR